MSIRRRAVGGGENVAVQPFSGGFTLIELIVVIVIVSVGLAGVMSVFNVVTRSSADPLRAKQAVAVAESMLEEILAKPFTSTGYAAACPATCDRTQFDDVQDYNNYARSGVRELLTDTSSSSSPIPALAGYNVAVSVATGSALNVSVSGNTDTVPATGYRIVTVTVTDTMTGIPYALSAYAFNND